MDVLTNLNYILLFIFIIVEVTCNDTNDTNLNGDRESRAAGRIVKLYSGIRPEPILCTDEGFQKDPYNCAVFYRCVKSGHGKYTVFRFECGPGTIYDPDTEVCNHPRSTKRSECVGYLPPVVDTTHINEIENINEVPSPIVTNKPIFISNVGATETFTVTTEKHVPSDSIYTTTTVNTYYPSLINQIYPEHNATIHPSKPTLPQQIFTQSTSTPHSNSRDNICILDGFMGDTENCRKFYRCVANERGGFTRYEFTCTETTIWDEDQQICNHVWAVKRTRCARQNNKNADYYTSSLNEKPYILENDEKLSTIQQQSQIGYGSKVTQSQTQIGHGSVVQNQTQIHYGERINEKKDKQSNQNQTQISDGSATSQTQTQINYGNEMVQTQLQIDHSKEVSQTQVQVIDSSTMETTSRNIISRKDDENNNECTNVGFMGDSKDCHKFYRCVDNGKGGFTKNEFSCAEGTVWDQSILACNHAWAVEDCSLKGSTGILYTVTPTTHHTLQNNPIFNSTTTEKYPNNLETMDKNDEDGYITQKPEDGYVTQKTTNNYTPSSTLITTISNQIYNKKNSECLSSGFIGDNNDCKIFYRCVENSNGGFTKYEFKCGEGTVWDPQIEACNHAWAVNKCGGSAHPDISKVDTTTKKLSTFIQTQSTTVTYVMPGINHINDNLETDYGSSNVDISVHESTPQYHVPSSTEVESAYPSNSNSDSDISITTSTTHSTTKNFTESNMNIVCTSEGFMGDKNNCKKFYRCVDNGIGGFIRYQFDCGEGTVWDQSIQACNHDSSTTKCYHIETSSIQTTSTAAIMDIASSEQSFPHSTENTASNDIKNKNNIICLHEGFMEDPSNCEKFYRCVDNGKGYFIRYNFSCGEGTYWNQEILSCDHVKSDKRCGEKVTSSTSKIPPHEHEDTPAETTITTKNENYITKKPPVSVAMCTSEGFYAEKNDCKKFYRCVEDGKGGYNKYDFVCGDGTRWNQDIQACDHEFQGKCLSTSVSLPSSEFTSPLPTEDQLLHGSTTSASTVAEANQCVSEGYFADSNDCKAFIQCVKNGKGKFSRYEYVCPEGTVWVQEMLTCYEDTENIYCDIQAIFKPTSSENQPQTTEKYEPITSGNVPHNDDHNSNLSRPPQLTSDDCLAEGYYENKNNCKEFFRCVNNGQGGYIKYIFTCSEGTAWDSQIKACNNINLVNCQGSLLQDEVSTQITQDSTTTLQYSSTLTTQKSSENNLETSSTTISMQTHLTTVTSDSEYISTTTTTQKALTTSKPNSKTADICDSEGFFGNSQDCKKFYRCVDNGHGGYTKYDFVCAEGTMWDQDITTCNHADSVGNPSCNQNGSTTETSSSNKATSSTSSLSTIEGSTTQNKDQNGITKKPETKVNCTKAGFYPNPDDCKKFYRCVDWDGNGTRFSVYHFECGEGTIWDPDVETCNHEESVYPPRNCGGSHSQDGDQSSTTEKTTTQKEVTESTTQSLTESTIESTTQSTTVATTELTTASITDPTTQSTTTQSTTKSITQATTESTLQSTTQPITTTDSAIITSTEQITTSTDLTTSSTTDRSHESTTETLEETTKGVEGSTTEKLDQSTTEKIVESTTDKAQESTTVKQDETTTEKSVETTTEKLDSSTTEKLEETTTQKFGESTTDQMQSTTTEKTVESTTEKSQESTTETLANTTIQESTTGTSTTELSTTELSTTESTITETTTAIIDKNSTDGGCPDRDKDQSLFVCPSSFRRHPKYCNLFYQCDENEDTHDMKIAMFTCPNNTIYDQTQTKCVEESKADKKCDGEFAQKRRVKRKGVIEDNYPIIVTKQSLACPRAGYFVFEKDSECSPGFLKCVTTKSNKLRGFVYICPIDYIFWSVSRRCEPINKVSDCKRSFTNDWNRRWNLPIENKNVDWS